MEYVGQNQIPLAVEVEAFKRAIHVMPEDEDDDVALGEVLRAAQDSVTTAAGRPLSSLQYAFTVSIDAEVPWRRWWFPCRPVTTIDKVEVNDASGDLVEVDKTGVRLIRGHDEPQLLLPEDWSALAAHVDTVRITATCGHASAPPALMQAIIMMAKEWRSAGITVDDPSEPPRLSMGVMRLIRQNRYRRPRDVARC